MKTQIVIIAFIWGATAGGVAGAQEVEPAPPSFQTLDRMGETHAIGISISKIFGLAEDMLPADATRVDLYGRWRRGPWGLYGQLSWTRMTWRVRSFLDEGGATVNLSPATGTTDIDAGATYSLSFGRHQLYLRGGVILPTASSDQFLANFVGVYARISDFATVWPGTLWLRPGATLRGGLGASGLVYQIDASVCLPIEHTDEDYPTQHTVGVVNAGVGASFDRVEVTGESANAFSEGRGFHSLAASLSYRVGEGRGFRPYLAYSVPFEMGKDPPARIVALGVNGIW
jgi:hypothetical protein